MDEETIRSHKQGDGYHAVLETEGRVIRGEGATRDGAIAHARDKLAVLKRPRTEAEQRAREEAFEPL